jgi:quinol monooxygenase YgiN
MICLGVTYTIKPGHEAEAAEHLRRLVPFSRAEAGCRMYIVHRSIEDPRMFFIYEQYDDQAAFDVHRASPHFLEHGKNGVQPLAESRTAVLCSPLES